MSGSHPANRQIYYRQIPHQCHSTEGHRRESCRDLAGTGHLVHLIHVHLAQGREPGSQAHPSGLRHLLQQRVVSPGLAACLLRVLMDPKSRGGKKARNAKLSKTVPHGNGRKRLLGATYRELALVGPGAVTVSLSLPDLRATSETWRSGRVGAREPDNRIKKMKMSSPP